MSPFERHGLKHLSASSLNKFRMEPALWTLGYLFGIRDNAGPKAWRGSAVEAGLDAVLSGSNLVDPEQAMLATFEREAQGEASDEVEKERACLPAMLKQARAAYADRPRPTATQLRVECWLDGIEVPVIGYADWIFADLPVPGDDMKTTHALPQSIKTVRPEYIRQAGIYMRARKTPWSLTFVSSKSWIRHEVPQEMADAAIQDLTRIARSLREALRRSETAEDFASLFAPDFNHYFWNPSLIEAAASVNAWRM